jgi:hypothetical protein
MCSAANCSLFNHLVGQRQQPVRDFEAERLGRLDVDHQLELCRQQNRQDRPASLAFARGVGALWCALPAVLL